MIFHWVSNTAFSRLSANSMMLVGGLCFQPSSQNACCCAVLRQRRPQWLPFTWIGVRIHTTSPRSILERQGFNFVCRNCKFLVKAQVCGNESRYIKECEFFRIGSSLYLKHAASIKKSLMYLSAAKVERSSASTITNSKDFVLRFTVKNF